MQSPVGVFDCNFGGYARLSDNYIEETTWEYERTHDVNGNLVSVGDPDAMIVNEPNSFSYNPGVTVASGSPQPPEVHFEYTAAAGYVSGLTLTAPAIPYINLGDDIEIACSHGSLGSQNVSYVVRPHPSNGSASTVTESSDNHYDDTQVVTSPSSSPVNVTFGPSSTNLFDTDKPGLYGLDVMAVDGSTNSSYTASSWIHKPIIVAPTDNHQLIFNIKDSYFAVLYGKPFDLMNVCKQVELNGHVIWREDISEGGDGWEQVQIDLMGQYVDENNTSP
ncbi:MAG: hypothetical protein IPP71_09195 [Bacteroidetes bacterium]|nr:hypothetical protein [Bacteroidota bacterium]